MLDEKLGRNIKPSSFIRDRSHERSKTRFVPTGERAQWKVVCALPSVSHLAEPTICEGFVGRSSFHNLDPKDVFRRVGGHESGRGVEG